MGMAIAATLKQMYPTNFDPAKMLPLTGNVETIRQLQEGVSVEVVASWANDLAAFDAARRKYFLYK